MRNMHIQVVSIIITENCNLACKYCYVIEENVGFGSDKQQVIKDDVLEAAIPFIIKEVSPYGERLRVDMYGGEPMLHFDKIKFFYEKFIPAAQEAGIWDKTQLLIFTNGTTGTEEIMNWMKPWYPKLDFSFSVDGIACSQNASRPFRNGDPSYDKVYENFEIYKKVFNLPENHYVHSRSVHTISPHNVMYLMDCINDYHKRGITPYHTFLDKDDVWDRKSIEIYREQRRLSTDFIIENFPKTGIMDRHMTLLINRRRGKYSGMCSSGKTLTAITQNGDLYPCHRLYQGSRAEKFKIGNVFDGIDKTSTYLGTLSKLGPDTIKDCINCKYGIQKWCDFQCTSARFESQQTGGNIFKVIPEVCELLYIEDCEAARIDESLNGNPDFERALQS